MLRPINKVVKILVFYDLVLFFGWGLIAPILAIFITEQIQGGDAKVVGIAVGVYWLLKSLLQMPIGSYLDKNHGEKDDYFFLIAGVFLASFVPLGFIFASLPWHIYLLEGIHAVGMAAAFPSWCGIFTRHVDEGKEAQSWALDSSAVGLGAGISGIIGGIIAKTFGFVPLLIGVNVLGITAALLCLLIKKQLLSQEKINLLQKSK